MRLILPSYCARAFDFDQLKGLSTLRLDCDSTDLQELANELLCTGEGNARREWALSLKEDIITPANIASAFFLAASQPSALSSLTALKVTTSNAALGSFAMMLLTCPSLRRLELKLDHDDDAVPVRFVLRLIVRR